jgi:hypothetical protein
MARSVSRNTSTDVVNPPSEISAAARSARARLSPLIVKLRTEKKTAAPSQ